MNYRDDEDLEFFKDLLSEDFEDLVFLLTKDKDGDGRFTETLTSSENYKIYYPEHSKYWKDIATELQHFGGNTFANLIRGEGVLYKEILLDVCNKLSVNTSKYRSIDIIEDDLLMKILRDTLDKMSPEDIKILCDEIGMDNHKNINKQAIVMAFQAIFKAGGFKSYQLTVIIANAVLKAIINRGLSFGANAGLTKLMSILTGPIGWTISGIWTAIDIAGAAYRVTIPAVIQVAYLRRKISANENV